MGRPSALTKYFKANGSVGGSVNSQAQRDARNANLETARARRSEIARAKKAQQASAQSHI